MDSAEASSSGTGAESAITKPWRLEDAKPGSYMPGMLGPEERKLLYHLARDVFSGAGEVIDLGAFCGASAMSLAAGLRDNPRAGSRRVHSYDRFIADEPYLIEFIREHFSERLTVGQSFEHIFRNNTAELSDRIDIHAGDLLEQRWRPREPIELLFIDAAKTPTINGNVLRQFFPSMIPGQSIVVHQDFHHPPTYFLIVVMDLLSDHFEIIEECRDYSAAFKLTSAIPSDKIERAATYDIMAADQLASIRRTWRRFRPENRRHIELAYCAAVGVLFGREAITPHLASARRRETNANDPIWCMNMKWFETFDEEWIALIRKGPLFRHPPGPSETPPDIECE